MWLSSMLIWPPGKSLAQHTQHTAHTAHATGRPVLVIQDQGLLALTPLLPACLQTRNETLFYNVSVGSMLTGGRIRQQGMQTAPQAAAAAVAQRQRRHAVLWCGMLCERWVCAGACTSCGVLSPLVAQSQQQLLWRGLARPVTFTACRLCSLFRLCCCVQVLIKHFVDMCQVVYTPTGGCPLN